MLIFLSDLIIPLFIVVILMAGLMSRRNVYADFVKGAKNGLKIRSLGDYEMRWIKWVSRRSLCHWR